MPCNIAGMPPLQEFQARINTLRADLAHAQAVQLTTLLALAGTLVLLLALMWLVLKRGTPAWAVILPFPAAFAAGSKYLRNRASWLRANRLKDF